LPMSNDFKRILDQFIQRYGKEKGTSLFYSWVQKRKLDDTKPYSTDQLKKKECLSGKCKRKCGQCLKESFQWAKPLIKLLKNDASGKTYQVEAHFAVTSLNCNVYTTEELTQAVSTLPGKHVDLNHNLNWVMEGVEILAAAWEDGAVEVLLHVDNGAVDAKGRDVQEIIERGVIDCVSIEGDSLGAETVLLDGGAVGNQPVGFYYTGLALLDQEALPGVPLTTIRPLEEMVLNESLFLESIGNEVKMNMSETQTEVKSKEAAAVFCPLCGGKLESGVCQNKDCSAFGKTVQIDAEKLAALNEALSKKDLALAEALEKQGIQAEAISKLTEDLSKTKAKSKDFEGRLREAEKRVSDRDKRLDETEKDIEGLRGDVGALTAARESAITEKNTAVAKAAEAVERANSETQERSRIQREMADLREKTAGAIRREAEASEKLAVESKLHLDLETENKQLKEDIRKRDNDIAEKQRSIEKALVENKRVYKILKENNIYEINAQGNLVIPA
jgi:hypothetical protein